MHFPLAPGAQCIAICHIQAVLLCVQGLKMFPAMVIVPTLQICWTLFSIVSGMLYFQEYQEMHALQAGMFALGVSVSGAHLHRLYFMPHGSDCLVLPALPVPWSSRLYTPASHCQLLTCVLATCLVRDVICIQCRWLRWQVKQVVLAQAQAFKLKPPSSTRAA